MSLYIIETPELAREICASLLGEPSLALDTETTGLEWSDLPFVFSMANREHEYVAPIELAIYFTPLFNTSKEWRFKNAKFDLHMMHKLGHKLQGRFHDITAYARLDRNDHFGNKPYSLANLANREGKAKDKAVDEYIKKHNLYEERTDRLGNKYKQPRYDWVPRDILYRYAGLDARLTFDLLDTYVARLDDRSVEVGQHEARVNAVCEFMEWEGIRVDLDYTRAARAEEMAKAQATRLKFKELTGIEFVDSAKCLEPVFRAAGEKIFTTDTGRPSFTADILDEYESPIAQVVRNIRGHEKTISTYYNNIITMADLETNPFPVIHPSMWPDGTRTGRFSYSDPNLQNLPKDEEPDKAKDPEAWLEWFNTRYFVRGCFIPRPGRMFVSLDYAQQEYRMMLAYAREQRLIERVMAGMDLHAATAELVGVTRKQAKTLNFAILYGAGDKKLAKMLGITVDAARKLRLEYFGALPMVEKFIDKVIRTGRARGHVVNWFGRRLYADREFCYALPNHLIQGGGADVIKVAMVKGFESGLFNIENLPVAQVHDQLLLDVAMNRLDTIPEVVKLMEHAFPEKNGMRLKVDVSWSTKSFAERDMTKGFPYESGQAHV